jgi:putative membrane protein
MSRKFLKTNFVSFFLTLGAITLSACTTTTAVAPPGSSLSAQDINFLTAAYQLIEFDTSECQVVNEGDFSAKVTQVANQVCSDANHYKPTLEQEASTYNVKLPDALRYDLEAEYFTFADANGVVADEQAELPPSQADQDSTYIMDQIGSHETALGVFREEAHNGALPALREFASQTVPVVEGNLQRLQAVMQDGN